MKRVRKILDDAAIHPDAIVTYRASNMVLTAHSNTSYISKTNTRSRTGGHFYMSDNSPDPLNNGAVIAITQIVKAIMSSVTEAEIGALYINFREAIPARHALEDMGHKHPTTPMQINNTTALGVVTNTIQTKWMEGMDMRLFWL